MIAFGSGINTYYKFVWQQLYLFILILAINLPLMYMYWSFGYYDNFEDSGSFVKFTLGNMGFS